MKKNNLIIRKIFIIVIIITFTSIFIKSSPDKKHQEERKQLKSVEEHNEEDEHVTLSDNAIKLAGIKTDQVKLEEIHKDIELPGEIGFNEDLFCKVVPRFSGIVKKINKKLGDFVNKGDTLALIESNESLTTYKIKSLISGSVIKKNITLGEFVSNETNVFEIANLSNVWVNLVVHAKNSSDLYIGQKVNIESVGTNIKIEGRISYISSFYNRKTRNLTARVIIPNQKGLWYPGTFIKGTLCLKGRAKVPVIFMSAVQILEGKSIVFIQKEKNEFEPVEVVLGEKNKNRVHIKKGLKSGDIYVSKGAFEIKAKLVTGTLGSHAGHGH